MKSQLSSDRERGLFVNVDGPSGATLGSAGFKVCKVDCSSRPPEQFAAIIRDQLANLLAPARC